MNVTRPTPTFDQIASLYEEMTAHDYAPPEWVAAIGKSFAEDGYRRALAGMVPLQSLLLVGLSCFQLGVLAERAGYDTEPRPIPEHEKEDGRWWKLSDPVEPP